MVDGNPYIRKGKDLFDRKDYAGAAGYLLVGTNLNRKSRHGLTYRAKALFRQDKDAEGRAVMNQIEVDENNYYSVTGMADLQMLAKEYHKAAVGFGAAAELKPGRAYPWTRRGRSLKLQARGARGEDRADLLREAERCLERAKQLNPDDRRVEQGPGRRKEAA